MPMTSPRQRLPDLALQHTPDSTSGYQNGYKPDLTSGYQNGQPASPGQIPGPLPSRQIPEGARPAGGGGGDGQFHNGPISGGQIPGGQIADGAYGDGRGVGGGGVGGGAGAPPSPVEGSNRSNSWWSNAWRSNERKPPLSPRGFSTPQVREDYNTYRAHPWSPFSLRRAHPGPGPYNHRALVKPSVGSQRGEGVLLFLSLSCEDCCHVDTI